MKLYCGSTNNGDYLKVTDDVNVVLLQRNSTQLTSVELNRENVKQLVSTLLKYLDKPVKVEGWVNVYDDGEIGSVFPSKAEAKLSQDLRGTVRQVQVKEV